MTKLDLEKSTYLEFDASNVFRKKLGHQMLCHLVSFNIWYVYVLFNQILHFV